MKTNIRLAQIHALDERIGRAVFDVVVPLARFLGPRHIDNGCVPAPHDVLDALVLVGDLGKLDVWIALGPLLLRDAAHGPVDDRASASRFLAGIMHYKHILWAPLVGANGC